MNGKDKDELRLDCDSIDIMYSGEEAERKIKEAEKAEKNLKKLKKEVKKDK